MSEAHSGENHHMFGKNHTDESKQKISENSATAVEIIIKDVTYKSFMEASKALDEEYSQIKFKVYSDKPEYSNYKLKDPSKKNTNPNKGKHSQKAVIIEGTYFSSIKEASITLKINVGTLRNRVYSENELYKEYKFADK